MTILHITQWVEQWCCRYIPFCIKTGMRLGTSMMTKTWEGARENDCVGLHDCIDHMLDQPHPRCNFCLQHKYDQYTHKNIDLGMKLTIIPLSLTNTQSNHWQEGPSQACKGTGGGYQASDACTQIPGRQRWPWFSQTTAKCYQGACKCHI